MEQKFPGKVSRNSESCLISAMRIFQPKVLEIPGAKLSRKKSFENLGMLREVVLFFGNLENTVPFVARICRNFKLFKLNGKAPKVYYANSPVFIFSVFFLFIVNAKMMVYFFTLYNTDDNCAESIKCPFLKLL